MKKGLIAFGFLASLTRALTSPIPCTANFIVGITEVGADAVQGLATEGSNFAQCFVNNLTGNVDSVIVTNPDIV